MNHQGWLEWQREFFGLAASVLCCRLVYRGGRGGGKGYGDLHRYDPVAVQVGELSYIVEMHLVVEEVQKGLGPKG